VDPSVLVTFLGLHDTPRFLHEPGATIAGLKLAFTFLGTTRGTPLIYYGDEIALRGGGDPDSRRDFPGGWREDPQNAFTKSGRTAEQESVHAHVTRLLTLRRKLEPLRRGALIHLAVSDATYAYARVTPRQAVVIACNNSPQPATLELPLTDAKLESAKSLTDRLGALGRLPVQAGAVRLALPGRSAAILTP
jgi:glycosidase